MKSSLDIESILAILDGKPVGNPFITNNPEWVKPVWAEPIGNGCWDCEHLRTKGMPNRACAERPVEIMFDMEGETPDADGVYHVEGLPPIVLERSGCSSRTPEARR